MPPAHAVLHAGRLRDARVPHLLATAQIQLTLANSERTAHRIGRLLFQKRHRQSPPVLCCNVYVRVLYSIEVFDIVTVADVYSKLFKQPEHSFV